MLEHGPHAGPVVERPAGSRPSDRRSHIVSTPNTPPPVTRRERRAAERRGAERRPGDRSPHPRPAAARPSVWRSPLVIVTGVAVVAMVAIIAALALTSGNGSNGSGLTILTPPESAAAAFADGEALGEADAPVVLEVYSDYQCPVCGRFSREYLPRLVSRFVSPGDLRIEEKAIAFLGRGNPDESLDAATAASCAAPDNRYWQFHDYLMWNQDGENEGAFGRERLYAMAARLGLAEAPFRTCLDDATVRDTIVARTQEAGDAGITSTPTFVVNGERLVGLVAYDELAALIETKLEAAPAP
jgi:protein-disulfide isomerase